jgi:hypothetical protein
MKKLIGILVLFLIISLPAKSQEVIKIQGQGLNMFIPIFRDEIELDVLGTPYMNDSWMYGYFHAYDTIKIEGLFRYNVFNQEIAFIYGEDTLSIAAPLNVDTIAFSGKYFTYSLYIEEKKGPDVLASAYFEILNDGDFKLLRKNYVEIKENSYAKNYMGGGGDGREYFIHQSSLYYKPEPGSAAFKLQKNKREILHLFKDKKEEISSYIKQNKLSISSEKDLIKIFNYYNQISA